MTGDQTSPTPARTPDGAVEAPPLEPLATHTGCPVSFNQERRLVLDEVWARRGVRSTAHLPIALRIGGPLDADALERALGGLVERHAALRAVYLPMETHTRDERDTLLRSVISERRQPVGLYCQSVLPTVRVPLERWCGESDRLPSRDRDLAGIVHEVSATLHSDRLPLMRAGLVERGADDPLLVIVASHLGMDGWSVALLVRELFRLYVAEHRRAPCTLPPVSIQQPDFAAWERRCVETGAFQREESYWLRQWSDPSVAEIAPGDLPFARPGSPRMTPVVARMEQPLGNDRSIEARRVLRERGITPYVFFRSVMTVALRRYTGRSRIAFYANFANRGHPSAAQMIGWCANRHVVVADVTPDLTFDAVCRRVALAVYEAQRHEALPLPALWHRIGRSLERARTRTTFDMWRVTRHRDGDLSMEPVSVPGGFTWMTLDVRVREDDSGFTFVVTYNRNSVASDGAKRLARDLQCLAAWAIEDLCSPLARLFDRMDR